MYSSDNNSNTADNNNKSLRNGLTNNAFTHTFIEPLTLVCNSYKVLVYQKKANIQNHINKKSTLH